MNKGLLSGINRPTADMGRIHIGPITQATTPQNVLAMVEDRNDYFGVWIQNLNPGLTTSTDFVAGNKNAENDPLAYFDFGVNGVNNANPYSTLFAANDAYLFTGGGNIGDINIATGTTGKVVKIAVGGLLAANEVARFTTTGLSGRITPRVGTTASSATPTINTDATDAYSITALAAAITSMTSGLTGTPNNFDKLTIRIKDNGTARAITWGASFESKGMTLPTTTVLSKVLTVGFIYDTVTSKWGCVAVAQEV